MERGYIRIVEATLLLVILVSLVVFISRWIPVNQPNPSNPSNLMRYGNDLVNMVCNSEIAGRLILSGAGGKVYRDLVYVTPMEYKVRLETENGSFGPVPDSDNIVSFGCTVSNGVKSENVTIMVWT